MAQGTNLLLKWLLTWSSLIVNTETYLSYTIFLNFSFVHSLRIWMVNSHFCLWMCNSLTNTFLKDKNTKFSHWKCKKCNKYIWSLTSVVTVNRTTYVVQNDKFVIEMIANVIMLTILDKNVSKILFLDINVNNFCWTKVSIFYTFND